MVTQQGRPQGDESRGIPQAYLFDWTGKCVAEGHPGQMDSKIAELMARAPHFLTAGRSFKSSSVQDVAKKLNKNKGFGKLVDELDKIAKKASGDEKQEAEFLKERLVGYGASELAKAKTSEGENAVDALGAYKVVSKLFKGHDHGTAADKRLKELKKDKDFQKELKAAKILKGVEMAAGQIKSNVKLNHPANRKPVATIVKGLKYLKKKYPESKAYAKAQELASSLGITK